jgi:hypothetical protein
MMIISCKMYKMTKGRLGYQKWRYQNGVNDDIMHLFLYTMGYLN